MGDFDAYVMREGVTELATPHVCRACKWWKDPVSHLWGRCNLLSEGHFDRAFISEGGRYAHLATKGDFGCNQWLKK